MGKRSDFPRRAHDAYDTPFEPVLPLIPMLSGIDRYAEPCVGNGYLVQHLSHFGLRCEFSSDIKTGQDALSMRSYGQIDAIITNPPWTRELLHPMIRHFQRIAPTWLLFDADWAFNAAAAPYLKHCSHIVSVGRVKWMEDSADQGKDNAAWYRFHAQHFDGPRFINHRVLTKPRRHT